LTLAGLGLAWRPGLWFLRSSLICSAGGGRAQDLTSRTNSECIHWPALLETWQLDPTECDLVLETLVKERFRARTKGGEFIALGSLVSG
jgi:hypothetical protein